MAADIVRYARDRRLLPWYCSIRPGGLSSEAIAEATSESLDNSLRLDPVSELSVPIFVELAARRWKNLGDLFPSVITTGARLVDFIGELRRVRPSIGYDVRRLVQMWFDARTPVELCRQIGFNSHFMSGIIRLCHVKPRGEEKQRLFQSLLRGYNLSVSQEAGVLRCWPPSLDCLWRLFFQSTTKELFDFFFTDGFANFLDTPLEIRTLLYKAFANDLPPLMSLCEFGREFGNFFGSGLAWEIDKKAIIACKHFPEGCFLMDGMGQAKGYCKGLALAAALGCDSSLAVKNGSFYRLDDLDNSPYWLHSHILTRFSSTNALTTTNSSPIGEKCLENISYNRPPWAVVCGSGNSNMLLESRNMVLSCLKNTKMIVIDCEDAANEALYRQCWPDNFLYVEGLNSSTFKTICHFLEQ